MENLNVPVTQPMAVLKGDLASITAQLEQWRDVSQEPPVWLDIEITTDEYLHDIQRKIQALTESLPVEVLLVRRSREQRERVLASQQRETLSELSVEEVFNRRLALEELDESQQQRLQHLSPRRCIASPENTKHENSQPAPENLNSLKANGRLISPASRSPATGCLLLPAQPVRGKPPCWTPFVWRCITKPRASLTFHNRKMIS